MADPVTRMNYFDHQFLRAEDFTLEQQYQNRMRRLHNNTLHTWGIVTGLEVDFASGATSVSVAKGVAIDSLGQEMVLDGASLDVANYKGKTVYVTIAYAEQKTNSTIDTGVSGDRNVTETPTIAASDQLPADGSQTLLLATVTVGADGKVTGKDLSGRRYAGVAGGDLQVRSLTLTSPTVDATAWPSLTCSEANTVTLTGNLSINGDLQLNDRDLFLRKPGDKNHGVGWYGSTKLFAATSVNGPVVYGYSGGALGTTNGGQKIALAWTNDGKLNNPMWKVTSLVQGKAWPGTPVNDPQKPPTTPPTNWANNFTTSGGSLILIVSGSIFGAFGKTIGVQVQIDADANKTWPMTYYENVAAGRISLLNHIVVPGIAAGSHTLSLIATADTRATTSELFSITLMEFPF
jgi:hypothetical protein